jgi:sterol desaturase/sphingolipid hydroxylase (fatty acid hydroxylase superfamily)
MNNSVRAATMDDARYGVRNKRGDWRPSAHLQPAPVFVFPPRPLALLKWLPHYFLPWNLLFMAAATVFWFLLTPDVATLQTLRPGWIAYLLLRNMAAVFLFYGALELRLYRLRRQGTQFKYNGKWPSESPGSVFMFGSQAIDNIIRTFAFALPIWTSYEVLILWAWANGRGPWTTFSAHPVWLVALTLPIPVIHEFHFFCVHRLIHVPVLYRWVHSVHHNCVNPSPWSSLSMHPVEHLLYWSGALLHLIVPSHPLIALYHIYYAGFGAVVGHIGFDKIVVGGIGPVDTHTYAHYLHHKYFEVNYADGLVPLDRLFGTCHDGSDAAEEAMNRRFLARAARRRQAT